MKVSVMMITYNHEGYIAQAINSVLMQNVDFDYELVIGEDCSTDNTRNIVADFRDRYPDKIRLVLSNSNVGMIKNAIRTLQACQGEYVALLEGDDYWTCTDKLQKQVDFLEGHPECTICFHNAVVVNDSGSQVLRNYCSSTQKEISTLEDLLKADFIPTCSMMFRNGLFGAFPDWIYKLPMGDWPLLVFNAQHGKIGYVNEIMASYRVHATGVYSRLGYAGRLQAEIQFYKPINAYLNYQYDDLIQTLLADRWDRLAIELTEQGFQSGLELVNLDHVTQIFENWPAAISCTSEWKAKVLGQIYERLVFASYNAHHLAEARYCLMKIIQYKPTCLHNPGMWSIGVEVILGNSVARRLRSIARILSLNRLYH
jgi:glycosyltransferase involved in cell wall biosynthesis